MSVFPIEFLSKCDDVNKYERMDKIGEGTYGEVFTAMHKRRQITVALKKLLNLDDPKVAFVAYREIRILKKLRHANVIDLIEVCQSNEQKLELFLIFPLCSHDLVGLIKNLPLSPSVSIDIMQQLVFGVSYIHEQNIMHLDLKPSNIFVTKRGVIKIGDFGLSNEYQPDKVTTYSNNVCSLWYRPPELLLGECKYTPSVDMWSVGCIFAEIIARRVLFHSETTQGQLMKIIRVCGSITPKVWPEVLKLQLFNQLCLPQYYTRILRDKVRVFNASGQDLLDRFLVLDPTRRIDAKSALRHNFFRRNRGEHLEDLLRGNTLSFFESSIRHIENNGRSESKNRLQGNENPVPTEYRKRTDYDRDLESARKRIVHNRVSGSRSRNESLNRTYYDRDLSPGSGSKNRVYRYENPFPREGRKRTYYDRDRPDSPDFEQPAKRFFSGVKDPVFGECKSCGEMRKHKISENRRFRKCLHHPRREN